MRIVLSDKPLDASALPEDVRVVPLERGCLAGYDTNADVAAIVGSRAEAAKAAELSFPGLLLFQLTSAGYDGVPLEKYAGRGVPVANAGDVYSVPVAETAVFGMLLLAKKLRNDPKDRRAKLTRHYGGISELAGKRALIMGAGNIGTAIAARLAGFDMHVDAYDPFCREKPQFETIIRDRAGLLRAVGEYDHIVSSLPDNETTRSLIDEELIVGMKKGAFVVSVGRLSAFDCGALYRALREKRLGGAALDIFEKLPNPVTNRFRRLPNAIVFPGVAAISREVGARLTAHITKNVRAALSGEEISNVINGVKK